MREDIAPSGRFDGEAHILPVRVYYEDTDFSGVVYHANYLKFFERGRSDFLRLAGVSHAALMEGPNPMAFAVSRMEIAFRRPARVDDSLLVRTTFLTPKGPRLPIAQSIWREGRLLVEAAVDICCIDLAGRPKKPPATVVAALQTFLAADGP
jgi:acyl-CoA thioester hydrolase